ncbi:MAG: pseudouridine synthase [Patescibacteria group bacterium]|jgi:pseudouridine synthase
MQIRINKYLSESGVCSRRQADEHILAGKISINGQVSRELGVKIDSDKDEVLFDGKKIEKSDSLVYFAFYKPKGVVTTSDDEQGRKTVLDFFPASPRIYPVGRLDQYSEGLVILTNDGDLTQKLTHPSFKHEKEYVAEARTGKLDPHVGSIQIVKMFTNGLYIDTKRMYADKVIVINENPESKLITLNMVLHTGYNRQIRRMCDKIGLQVVKLVRTRVAKLSLESLGLEPGESKEINLESIL